MAYGTVKVDNITFDNGGSDQNVTVSGLYRATTSGVTVTGTISGAVLVGTTTVSGATVTGMLSRELPCKVSVGHLRLLLVQPRQAQLQTLPQVYSPLVYLEQ